MAKKYYWLKLQRDFFKRHDIRIIESMPNGKDYLLFYLKLLCESIDHNGNLRFSDQIPYNEDMLATITNTNVDIVRSAITVFTQLNMMELLDDGTFYMSEVEKMIGSETEWAEKKRAYRLNSGQCPQSVLPMSDKSKSIEKDIDKDLDIDIIPPIIPPKGEKKKTNRFVPPTIDEISEYCRERKNNVNPEKFFDFYESKGWMVGKNKMKDWKAAVRTWEKHENAITKPRTAPVGITEYQLMDYNIHPQVPPYFGFPTEWFDNGELVKDRMTTIRQPQNLSVGVTDETIYTPDDLWKEFELRKRGYEHEQF